MPVKPGEDLPVIRYGRPRKSKPKDPDARKRLLAGLPDLQDAEPRSPDELHGKWYPI